MTFLCHHAKKNIITALNAKKRPVQAFFSFRIENHCLIRQNSSLARIRAFLGIREKSMNLLYPFSLNRTEIALFRQSVDLEASVLFFRRIQAFALVADEYRQQNSFF
jgi:hypothetical protein